MVHINAKRQSLPAWIEQTVRLSAGIAAEPGPIKLYPYQRGIDAILGNMRARQRARATQRQGTQLAPLVTRSTPTLAPMPVATLVILF
jgi:hypothetical protein